MNTFLETKGNSKQSANIPPPRHEDPFAVAIAATIEAEVCRVLRVGSERLHFARQGQRRVSDARHLAIYLIMTVAGATARAAAAHFGRHRSTGLHAMRSIEARREADEAFDRAVTSLAQVAQTALDRCRAHAAVRQPTQH